MGKLVCVVEDNVSIRKLECLLLKKAGYNVADFGEGLVALEWIKNNRPDLMLLDILLPDTNGTDVMKEIKAMPGRNDFPIVAATGFVQLSDRERYLDEGFDAYIGKPLDVANFTSQLSQICSDYEQNDKK